MSHYANGANLERRVARELAEDGYDVRRIAGSRGLVDLYAFKVGETLDIQVKASGRLDPEPWNALYEYATSLGHVPLLACREGRKIRFWRLVGRKVPRSRVLPRELWVADRIEGAA